MSRQTRSNADCLALTHTNGYVRVRVRALCGINPSPALIPEIHFLSESVKKHPSAFAPGDNNGASEVSQHLRGDKRLRIGL